MCHYVMRENIFKLNSAYYTRDYNLIDNSEFSASFFRTWFFKPPHRLVSQSTTSSHSFFRALLSYFSSAGWENIVLFGPRMDFMKNESQDEIPAM